MADDNGARTPLLSQVWDYGRGLLIILGFCALGFGIQRIDPIPFPAPLVGMLLLWAAVQFRLVRIAWIERAGALLLRHMSLFFLPILLGAVRNMPHSPRLLAAIVLAVFGGTFITLWLTHTLCERWVPEAEGGAA
jgi:holin-like protein